MSNVQTPTPGGATSMPDISPSQRAAVVVAMLGETSAKPIVDLLDDRAVAKMAASLETITYLSREQLVEIVIDFLRHLRKSSGAMRNNPETAKTFLTSVLDEPRLQLVYGGDGEVPLEEQVPEPENKEDYSRLWRQFADRDPAHIAKYLSGLTANIVALILRNLDTTKCSELICLLEENQQTKILGEMVNPPPPSHEIDAVIARMVRMEFLLVPETDDDDDGAQLQSVGEMLSLMPNERRASLMSYVAESHAGKVGKIQKGMFEIADIPKLLPRNQLPILVKALEPTFLLEVLNCLQNQYKEVSEYFLSNISNRMADQFRDDLGRMKAPSPDIAEQIEKDFLMKLMELKRDEVIIIERPEEDEEEAQA